MRKPTIVVLVIVVLALLGGGIYAVTKKDKKTETDTAPTTQNITPTSDETTTNEPEDTGEETEISITYDGSTFSPEQVTVKAGSKVMIKNGSSETIQFASDPHPAHTDNSELNAGSISPGQSKTITLNEKGTFGYHDHLNPNKQATIVVE